jgi:hypothetical protein
MCKIKRIKNYEEGFQGRKTSSIMTEIAELGR